MGGRLELIVGVGAPGLLARADVCGCAQCLILILILIRLAYELLVLLPLFACMARLAWTGR